MNKLNSYQPIIKQEQRQSDVCQLLTSKSLAVAARQQSIKFLHPTSEYKISKENFLVTKTKKLYLMDIQKGFSPSTLYAKPKRDDYLFLYSNDCSLIKDYYQGIFERDYKIQNCKQLHNTFQLFDHLKQKEKHFELGVVVGNGSILSLLPEIPVDDIILVDIEPVIHYFILCVKKLIVEADIKQNFNIVRKDLIIKISSLYDVICPDNSVNGKGEMYSEMANLRERHYLSCRSRFIECRQALIMKELLPVEMDLFNLNQMQEFGEALKKGRFKVKFLNLTNVADYDRMNSLYPALKCMPLSNDFTAISTSLSNSADTRYFISTNLQDLRKTFRHEIKRPDLSRSSLCTNMSTYPGRST